MFSILTLKYLNATCFTFPKFAIVVKTGRAPCNTDVKVIVKNAFQVWGTKTTEMDKNAKVIIITRFVFNDLLAAKTAFLLLSKAA